jgi:hypothetical protein
MTGGCRDALARQPGILTAGSVSADLRRQPVPPSFPWPTLGVPRLAMASRRIRSASTPIELGPVAVGALPRPTTRPSCSSQGWQVRAKARYQPGARQSASRWRTWDAGGGSAIGEGWRSGALGDARARPPQVPAPRALAAAGGRHGSNPAASMAAAEP